MKTGFAFVPISRGSISAAASCVRTALFLALELNACRPEEEPPRCESLSQRAPLATGAELCATCADGEGLCATDPQLLASGCRINGPDVAWTGEDLGVVWGGMMPDCDARHGVRFARVSPRGKVLYETMLSRGMGESGAHVIWTGSEFGITWGPPIFMDPTPPPSTPDDPIVALVGSDGTLRSPEHRGLKLFKNFRQFGGGKLAWNGTEYVVAWWDGLSFWLSRASATGERIGDDALLSNGASDASIVWNGNAFAVAYGELSSPDYPPRTNSLRLLEVSTFPSGAVPPSVVPIIEGATPSGAEPPTVQDTLERPNPRGIKVDELLWMGDEYVLLWSEANDLHEGLYLARIAPGTADVRAMTIVSERLSSEEASLVWTGSRFVVAWAESTRPFRDDLFVASYSHELERMGGPLQLSAGTGITYTTFSAFPALAVANDLVLVVWSSTDESMIRCPPQTAVLAFAQVATCP